MLKEYQQQGIGTVCMPVRIIALVEAGKAS